MRASSWLKLLAAGTVALGLAAVAFRKPKLEVTKIATAKVERATVVRKIRAAGHVEPVTQIRVSANISGDLLVMPIKEGQRVEKGTVLGEIDRERFLAIVRQAEAAVRSAQAALRLEDAQIDEAKVDLDRLRKMREKGLTTDVEIEKSEARVRLAETRIEGAKERVEQARAALDEAKARLQQTRLVAPIAGTVIELKKKVGERVRGSDFTEDVVMVLAPLQAMEVEVEIAERETPNVKLGQRAEIEIDALDDLKVGGVVAEIASSATIKFRGEERETTSFRVKVGLDEIPERLRSGMSAQVAIITDTREGAVAVPIEAVTARTPAELALTAAMALEKQRKKRIWERSKEDEEPLLQSKEKPVRVVFVVEGAEVKARRVSTGISSEERFEITEGLEPGQEIVVGPYKALAKTLMDGSPVEIAERVEPKKP